MDWANIVLSQPDGKIENVKIKQHRRSNQQEKVVTILNYLAKDETKNKGRKKRKKNWKKKKKKTRDYLRGH